MKKGKKSENLDAVKNTPVFIKKKVKKVSKE